MLRTLSTYERERLENIKRNNEFLAALGLEPLRTAPQQQTSKKRPHDIPSDLKPRRKSARYKGSKKPVYNEEEAFDRLLHLEEESDEDSDPNSDESDEDSDESAQDSYGSSVEESNADEDGDESDESNTSSGCWVEFDENEPHDPSYDCHFTSSPSSPSSSSSSSSSSSLSPSFKLSSSYSSSSRSSTSSWSPASSGSSSSYSTSSAMRSRSDGQQRQQWPKGSQPSGRNRSGQQIIENRVSRHMPALYQWKVGTEVAWVPQGLLDR
jgi:hypothetical protein